MRRWAFVVSCVLVLHGSLSTLAQQPTGSAATENHVGTGEVQESAAGPKQPAGTLIRPEDGVKHVELDKAWEAYSAAVDAVTESLRTAIAKQFDVAAAKGDLDSAERLQLSRRKFEEVGEIPSDKEIKSTVRNAVADYRAARDQLVKAYETVVKELTTEKKLEQAKAVRAECQMITSLPYGTSESRQAMSPKQDSPAGIPSVAAMARVNVQGAQWIKLVAGIPLTSDANAVAADVPATLRGRAVSRLHAQQGKTTFSVLSDGAVLLACTDRFGGGGNANGGWMEECTTRDELKDQGWSEVSKITYVGGMALIVFRRDCSAGESFTLRTEKYHPPLLIR